MMWLPTATLKQARTLRAAIAARLGALGLELHPDKAKIVYCKDANRRGNAEHTSFDFLGYTFRGRPARGRHGYFVSFSPAMSIKAKKAKGQQIRAWHLNRRSGTNLSGLAEDINPQTRGWIDYYGAFYRSELYPHCTAHRRAVDSISSDGRCRNSNDYEASRGEHGNGWRRCVIDTPAVVRPLAACLPRPRSICGSRMTGDCHVRFCESGRGRLPPATHPIGGRWPNGINLRGPLVPGRRLEHATIVARSGLQPQQRSAEPAAYLTDRLGVR